jgi:predicted PurR-regulated permease PerM
MIGASGGVGSVSLAVLAVLAVIFTLDWGSAVCIPVMLALTISYALSPVVNQLQQWRIPRAVGAAAVLLGIVGGIGALAYSLSDETAELIETLPDAARNFRQILHEEGVASPNAMGQVQEAAGELERAAQETGVQDPQTSPRGVTRVQVETPKLNISDYLWSGTLGAAALAGQAAVVLFMVYFMLVVGDTYRRKLVKITGPALSKKKVTVQVLDEITNQIQRYLLVQTATGTLGWHRELARVSLARS